MKYLSIIILILGCIQYVGADQPVSCLRQQFHDQVWLFHVSPQPDDINLFDQQEVCTHNIPNKVQIIDKNYNFAIADEDVWAIMVKSDFSAEGRLCKGGNSSQCSPHTVNGHWLTIYDQTLIVELDNDLRFIGTFRYQVKQNVTKSYQKLKKVFTDVDDFMKAQFNSVCNQTMAGFVQNKTHQSTFKKHRIQCMYATKDWSNIYEAQIGGIPMPATLVDLSDSSLIKSNMSSNASISSNETSLLQLNQYQKQIPQSTVQAQQRSTQVHRERSQKMSSGQKKAGNLLRSFKPSVDTDQRIIEVADNQKQYTWQPNMCMLTRSHPRFNKTACLSEAELKAEPDEKETESSTRVTNNTFHAIMETLGLEEKKEEKKQFVKHPLSGTKKFGEKTDEFLNAASYAQRYRKEFKSPDHIPDHMVPKEYDLRNLQGYDFTGNLRDQGACGSCYTNSFIQAIEGRMKLKYAHQHIDQPDLSLQFIMTCNYLTEGCDGGWAIFDGFFAEQGGIPTEQCVPYKAKTKNQKCSDYSNCEPHTRVLSSYYVNGYNFDPTVLQIQKEILYNGPVTTEFAADGEDFQLYKSGIMVQKTKPPEKDNSANYAQQSSSQATVGDEYVQTKGKFANDGQDSEDKVILEESKQTQQAISQINPQTIQATVQSGSKSKAKMGHQPLDHSIYIVGWGHDKEQNLDYWIIRNSYGDTWGMNGDFHVRRGFDDFGCESEISGFEVELAQNDKEL